MCVSFFKVIKASIDLFCARRVCIQKHTCVRPQQELVGQPLTLECSPQSTSSAKHIVCVCVCVYSSNWSAKVVERSEICNPHVCVCVQQQLVGQPAVDFFYNACVHVLTAAIGLPKF